MAGQGYIDAHSHVDGYTEEQRARVLHEIEANEIRTLGVAMDLASYLETAALASRCAWLVPCLGVHPERAAAEAGRLDDYLPYLDQVRVIGEIGLDFHWVEDRATDEAQRKVFEFFLAEAARRDLPVNLHTKGAEQDVREALRRHGIRNALVHWYSGPWDVFEQLAADGCYFSIGVEVTVSERIKGFAEAAPLPQLLLETDNPGGLRWLGGGDGFPLAIADVYAEVARVRGMSVDELRSVVGENFDRYLNGN